MTKRLIEYSNGRSLKHCFALYALLQRIELMGVPQQARENQTLQTVN